jgi:hypothetical protein
MEMTEQEIDYLGEYLQAFDPLIGDERTGKTFQGVIAGILASESLRTTLIGRFSPGLAGVKYAERRIRRMAKGESTQRSRLGADEVMGVVEAIGAFQLSEEREILCVMDGSDLRRPWAQEQAYLMRVKSLEGGLVNGYRTLNVLGL